MCMATGGKDSLEVEDVGSEYGLVKAVGAKRPDGWVYRFPTTNTTILYYWSASLYYLEPLNITDPATDYAMHLDCPPAFLQRSLHRFNVLVLNTGHDWNRGKLNANRWVMYVGGEPIRDRKLAQIGNAKNFTIYSVINFHNTHSSRPFSGPYHPDIFQMGIGTLEEGDKVSQDESDDSVVAGAVKGTRVRLLQITTLSQLREEGHISRYSLKASHGVQDCLHWCLPGISDTWNEILYAQLLVAD
ncbi:protein trichome birefringence-like protein 14 isoform X1 [Cinnamomum micranthum f. kanehirae]|uniref:Protein trichome birefringence-like protein 14 isoform X1 n=1 Tax=Cinnamomum micranthum f. kanehirae TaxID=337451 RepID=A0A3S3N3W4_9MAGN|nr:protein trichome birefringence-like protein 14 isoform X1 [Cinnamomum micranthum f. kanehirae]